MGNLYPYAPFWSLGMLTNDPVPPQGEVVSLERIESHTGRLIEEGSASTASGRAFKPGDVLFGKLRPYLAKYWLSDSHGTAQGDIHVYRPADETEPKFLAYLVGSKDFVGMADTSSTGTKMPRVEWSKVAQFPVPKPPLEIQRAIADYLDRETAEIDAMSADLDEMEALLTERKVNAAVHRIDQNTGEGASPLGTVVRSHLGGSGLVGLQTPAAKGETGILKTSAVSTGEFRESENRALSQDDLARVDPAHVIRPGDLLLNRLNSPEYVGAMAYVPEALGSMIFSDKIWRLNVAPNLDPEYLSLWSLTPAYRKQVGFSIVGTSHSMQSLGFGTFQRFRIAVPPLEQQRAIVEVVRRDTAEIDSMLADVTELRDLLTERRAAVIAAAVTGQIEIPTAEEPIHA